MSDTAQNIHEYTVSELSQALKRHVEDGFSHVRVRGEISGFKRAASGHMYLGLKEEKTVIDGVCWKGVAAKLSFQPEDGLEVICTGKLTTYPDRSKYQIVITSMEPAGAGAMMAMLEERKKKLSAEGLFAPDRKKEIPYLPRTIGVVTSPTGAVIRDILHRLADRLALDDTGRDLFDRGQFLRFDRSLAVDRLSKRVHDSAEQARADWNFENPARRFHDVAFGDMLVIAENDGPDRIPLEIQSQPEGVAREFNHLAVLHVTQTVNSRDAVCQCDYRAYITRFRSAVEVSDALFDKFADFRSFDCHLFISSISRERW